MKSFFVAIFSMLLLICSLASCNHAVQTVEVVSFDTLSVDTVCTLFKNYDKPACHINIKLVYPDQNTSADFQKSFRHFVANLSKEGGFDEESNDTFLSMARNYVHSYIINYLGQGKDAIDSYGNDMEAAATWMSYEELVDGSVTYQEDDIICYRLNVSSYTGGAHGFTDVELGVFSVSRLEGLELADVFNYNNLQTVNQLIRETLVKNYDCESLDDLAQNGLFFSPEEIEATENFQVDENGITWIYDPYEIAPYSTGEVSVCLPWSVVIDLISVNSPLKVLAEKYS